MKIQGWTEEENAVLGEVEDRLDECAQVTLALALLVKFMHDDVGPEYREDALKEMCEMVLSEAAEADITELVGLLAITEVRH